VCIELLLCCFRFEANQSLIEPGLEGCGVNLFVWVWSQAAQGLSTMSIQGAVKKVGDVLCFAVSHVALTAGLANVCVVMQEPTEESPAAPDSTTKERSGFSEGEDVLFQHKDGRYYLGTIVEVRTEPITLHLEACET